MSAHDADLDLSRPAHNGVYFVDEADLDTMATAAARAELGVCRVDLAACHDKAGLLRRMAGALPLPADFGHNWDALYDSVNDLEWLEGEGYLLLFDHADELRSASEEDFDALLDILDEASEEWQDGNVPFFAFFAMPESAFNNPDF